MIDPRVSAALKRMVPEILTRHYVYDGQPLRLDDWQWTIAGSDWLFDLVNKCRQGGFSFIVSAQAVVMAQLMPENSFHEVFVSINKDESLEKVRYCQQLYDELPDEKKIECTTDNKTEIWFANGNSIRSYPSKAVRGVP